MGLPDGCAVQDRTVKAMRLRAAILLGMELEETGWWEAQAWLTISESSARQKPAEPQGVGWVEKTLLS